MSITTRSAGCKNQLRQAELHPDRLLDGQEIGLRQRTHALGEAFLGDGPEVGAKLAYQAVLVSPHFLFRIEKDPAKTDFKFYFTDPKGVTHFQRTPAEFDQQKQQYGVG